jgi:hypothetical protein
LKTKSRKLNFHLLVFYVGVKLGLPTLIKEYRASLKLAAEWAQIYIEKRNQDELVEEVFLLLRVYIYIYLHMSIQIYKKHIKL